MHAVPPAERGLPVQPPGADDALMSRALLQSRVQPGDSSDDGPGSEGYRPIRKGPLRDLLDEEFSRNYRFEGLSDFFQDLKGFLRKVVVREEELEEFGEFLAGTMHMAAPETGRSAPPDPDPARG